jgi:hypothetical protein
MFHEKDPKKASKSCFDKIGLDPELYRIGHTKASENPQKLWEWIFSYLPLENPCLAFDARWDVVSAPLTLFLPLFQSQVSLLVSLSSYPNHILFLCKYLMGMHPLVISWNIFFYLSPLKIYFSSSMFFCYPPKIWKKIVIKFLLPHSCKPKRIQRRPLVPA